MTEKKIDNPDLKSYIWKGLKTLDENGKYKQSEQRLVDMTEPELRNCYNHCKTMLYNKDPQNLGRYLVMDLICDQRDRCGAELFLRYIEQNTELSRFSLIESINQFLTNNKEALKGTKPLLNVMFSNIPNEFERLPISLVLDGCLAKLGTFDKKHITRTFILKQGIWLTPAESKDLLELDSDGNPIDKLLVIRERLNIKDVEKLYLNSKGLNYTQMRALLMIKPNKKYMDFTTMQLETLRNRMLFTLEVDVANHIVAWEDRMSQIEQVAEFKHFKLV